MKHAGQKTQAFASCKSRGATNEMWRFTISPEIDLWRNVRQLDRHRVEIFIALSCRDGFAAQSLGDLDSQRAHLAVVPVTVSPNSISFGCKKLNSF
jgi:hypothetical protein